MKILDSRTFRVGKEVALALPAELGIVEDVDLEIIQHGNEMTIRPKRKRMTPKELVDALRRLPKPSSIQEREPIEFPERPGL